MLFNAHPRRGEPKKAGEFFNCSYNSILPYIKNGKLFKKEWILLTFVNKK